MGMSRFVMQTFTANTIWRCPDGITSIMITGFGGGGGGGGGGRDSSASGGGGGGGGAIQSTVFVSVTPLDNYTITIGAGGTGGAGATGAGSAGTDGSPGGNTIFASLAIFIGASGGGGGQVTAGSVAGGGVSTKGLNGFSGASIFTTINFEQIIDVSTLAYIGPACGGWAPVGTFGLPGAQNVIAGGNGSAGGTGG